MHPVHETGCNVGIAQMAITPSYYSWGRGFESDLPHMHKLYNIVDINSGAPSLIYCLTHMWWSVIRRQLVFRQILGVLECLRSILCKICIDPLGRIINATLVLDFSKRSSNAQWSLLTRRNGYHLVHHDGKLFLYTLPSHNNHIMVSTCPDAPFGSSRIASMQLPPCQALVGSDSGPIHASE